MTVLWLALFVSVVCAVDVVPQHDHRYMFSNPVALFVNKIGPYANPSETYDYYILPFCGAENKEHHKLDRKKSLGEALEGDHISNSQYDIRFDVAVQFQKLCDKKLSAEDVRKFKNAIQASYYFEMFIDDLPVRGFIGAVDDSGPVPRYYLFKHLHFFFLKNGDRVIHVNVTADLRQVQPLEDDAVQVEFSYSVEWHKTDVVYMNRMQLFRDTFFDADLDIHWLSILNSFVLVLLLTGFVVLILRRILHSDYDRYARKAEHPDEDIDDSGWKLVHGDVFRLPGNVSLLAAFCGSGVHLAVVAFVALVFALAGFFPVAYTGAAYARVMMLFSFTSVLSGLASAAAHRHLRGAAWHWNAVLSACVFCVPFLAAAVVVNAVSFSYKVTTTLSADMMGMLFLIWLVVIFPLTLIGAVAGRRLASEYVPPHRVSNFVRSIPSVPFYTSSVVQFVAAGFLPFTAIYIELYYVYLSVWGRNSYTLFGILLIVALILICVTSAMTVAMTYFQLSQEDHRWWWRSFINGGATSVFVYGYSVFYYVFRSQMTGALQAVVYFFYMLVVAYSFFLVLGTTGFVSSYLFVHTIYTNIKSD